MRVGFCRCERKPTYVARSTKKRGLDKIGRDGVAAYVLGRLLLRWKSAEVRIPIVTGLTVGRHAT
jgi:hypothetical protein